MQRNATTRRAANAGFSIMELLLVLVILAVLTGIVSMKFSGASGKAKVSAAKQEMSNLQMMLSNFEISAGRYPTTSEGLKALYEKPSNLDDGEWERYMDDSKDLVDPWGQEWQYRESDDEDRDYELFSYGPDGREGGDDDVRSWSDD